MESGCIEPLRGHSFASSHPSEPKFPLEGKNPNPSLTTTLSDFLPFRGRFGGVLGPSCSAEALGKTPVEAPQGLWRPLERVWRPLKAGGPWAPPPTDPGGAIGAWIQVDALNPKS